MSDWEKENQERTRAGPSKTVLHGPGALLLVFIFQHDVESGKAEPTDTQETILRKSISVQMQVPQGAEPGWELTWSSWHGCSHQAAAQGNIPFLTSQLLFHAKGQHLLILELICLNNHKPLDDL
ncbi:uncharacterized protein GJ701_001455 [Geothlypis trichas]